MKKLLSIMFTAMIMLSSSMTYAQCTEGTKFDAATGDCVPADKYQSGSSGVRG